MSLDIAVSRGLQDHLFGIAEFPMPTDLRVRVMVIMGNANDPGIEAEDGGGYTGGANAPVLSFMPSSMSGPGVASSAAAIVVDNWPRDEYLIGIEVWDGTTRRIAYGEFSEFITMAVGDTLTIPAGAITSILN